MINFSTKEKPTVLLATTACWYPMARLAMALHQAGCRVEAVCPAAHPLRMTASADRIYAYRGLSPLQSFIHAINASQPDFIVSGDDLATQHLHRLHEREGSVAGDSLVCVLIERSLGSTPSFPVVRARAAFMDVVAELGVRVPHTRVIRDAAELTQWIAEMGLPTMLKANGTSGGEGVRIVRTLAEGEDAFRQLQAPPLLARAAKRALLDRDATLLWPSLLRHKPVVNAQAFVAGREATSTVFCSAGAVLASLHCEVVRKASSAGHATVVRPIENAEMSFAVESVVGRLGLSGFLGFDFMLESETENAYLIEINPRATQVGHLALGRGRDLPAALYALLSGKAVQPASAATDEDTIALFPQEWIRDAGSAFLHSGYHDVPWSAPELIRHCIGNGGRQRAWYTGRGAKQNQTTRSRDAAGISMKGRAAELTLVGK